MSLEQKYIADIIDYEFYLSYLLIIPKGEVSESVTHTLIHYKSEDRKFISKGVLNFT